MNTSIHTELGRQMNHSAQMTAHRERQAYTLQLEPGDFRIVLRASEETKTMQENVQDWLELDEGDPGFQHLVQEAVPADVGTASAMEEGSDK
jgi:hypothetical protein